MSAQVARVEIEPSSRAAAEADDDGGDVIPSGVPKGGHQAEAVNSA
jgi:hypothetical protein